MKREKIQSENLEERIIENLNVKNYSSFSPLQKFRFCNEAMSLCKDYCCEQFDFEKKLVQIGFVHDAHSVALSSKIDDENFVLLFNTFSTLRLNNPYLIYKSCFHEMKHIASLVKGDSISLNYNPKEDVSKSDWQSSQSEIDADKFAYQKLLSFGFNGLIKSVFKANIPDYAKMAYYSISSSIDHFSAQTIFSLKKLYPFQKQLQIQQNDENQIERSCGGAKQKEFFVLSENEIENVAFDNKEAFLSPRHKENLLRNGLTPDENQAGNLIGKYVKERGLDKSLRQMNCFKEPLQIERTDEKNFSSYCSLSETNEQFVQK